MGEILLLDCTLRDGGYYNAWDFDSCLINEYLRAMEAVSVDCVELGFRSVIKEGYKGACAYTTEEFLRSLEIPRNLKIGVMVNANELINYAYGIEEALTQMFIPADESFVDIVRIVCHVHEFEKALTAAQWLKDQGYYVGYNLMQVADRTFEEIGYLAMLANQYPVDVLYFADSMGSLTPDKTAQIVQVLKQNWSGNLGIHTHDSMGQAHANSLRAIAEGVNWIDSTVTGMGRGPGNAKTEYLAVELADMNQRHCNLAPLMRTISRYFKPLQQKYQWGSNIYYYLSGREGIHPTYIQEMLCDTRYEDEDILAVIEYLKKVGGKKFNLDTLEGARNFYHGEPRGFWNPYDDIQGREVLIIGTGPGGAKHREALELYIKKSQPYVIALNTQNHIAQDLIDIRAACHPVRLLADYYDHLQLPQPLAIPASMLPETIGKVLQKKDIYDFGILIEDNTFKFATNYCVLPNSIVIAYALAIATCGKASRILLAGFDGYGIDNPKNRETDEIFELYHRFSNTQLLAVTSTRYQIATTSIYSMI